MASTDFRLTGLDTRGADLTFSALELLGAGGRVDVGAAITSSHAPTSGTLSALGDGDPLTSCTFAAADVASPGFWIGIQVSAAQEVTAVAFQGWLYALTLGEMVGGAWSTVISAQDTRGLPSVTGIDEWVKVPSATSDLVDYPGIASAVTGAVTVVEGGVKYANSISLPAFARVVAGPVVAWRAVRAKLTFKFTRDGLGYRHAGFFFPDAGGNTGGYRVAYLNGSIVYSAYVNGVEINGTSAPRVPVANPTIGSVYTLEVRGLEGGGLAIYQNDALIGTLSGVNAIFSRVTVGVFAYNADIEIQRIEVSTNEFTAGPPIAKVAHASAVLQGVAPIPPSHTPFQLARSFGVADLECGGQGCIYGTVELYAQAGNIPLPRRVRLHRSRDGMLVRETWSDAQGNYSFDHISERYTYDVIAWDHEGLQQSVVANDLTPEVMP